jgi:hypothetical protein
MIAHKHTHFLFQRVWGRFMAGQVLLSPVNFSPHSDQGQDEASVLESLWGSGAPAVTASARTARKRKNFAPISQNSKRRVRKVLSEERASAPGVNDPIEDGEDVLSVQVALSPANPALVSKSLKAAKS